MQKPAIHVVAAVVRDDSGRILLAQRAEGSHLAGLWEFPGGKREVGETPWQALVRELDEEIGIVASAGRPLIAVPFAYPGKRILLDVWQVDAYAGTPWSREGQPLQWVAVDALDTMPMPAADRPVVAALRLPQQYLITPDWPPGRAAELRDGLLRSLQDGIRLIRLRLPQWSAPSQLAFAAALLPEVRAHAAALIGSGNPVEVIQAGFDGLHLSAAAAARWVERPIPTDRWLAVSCHDQAELEQAARIGADFVTLSPLLPTPSHPGTIALGWESFTALVRDCAMPVFALGGLDSEALPLATACGAQGIAGIRGLWLTDVLPD